VLFKVTLEKNDQIVFLDLTLKKVSNKITFDIYRKPTDTNLAISNSSNHPFEHTLVTNHSMSQRMNTLILNGNNKGEELNVIIIIANHNMYDANMAVSLNIKFARGSICNVNNIRKKWVSFMYSGSFMKHITELFKYTNIQIASKTNNITRNVLKSKTAITVAYNSKNIYKLTMFRLSGSLYRSNWEKKPTKI
jgi:hypothetical protein